MTTSTRETDDRALDALTRTLAAAARLRAIDMLRDGLEHELRSPLNAIVLNIELLRELVRAEGGPSAVVQLERLETISAALRRLQAGLTDLLDFTHEPDATPTRFELADLAADAERRAIGQFRQKGLTLAVDVPPGLRTRGRREGLTQALIQLLLRAIQVSPAGTRVEVTGGREGAYLTLDVRDAGPGVEPERRPGLFEDRHGSELDSAGAGLYVARKLIEADGGELRLASSGADGTVIRAQFPEVRQ